MKQTETSENGLFCNERKVWIDNRNNTIALISWCNGVSGLLLGRLLIRKNLNSKLERIDNYLIDYMLNYYEELSIDDSICHGNSGNLLIINYIVENNLSQNYRVKDLKKLQQEIRIMIKENILANKFISGYN